VIDHKVLEVVPSGYEQTAGNDGYTITVDATTGIADATGLDFANFNLVDLSGTKFLDKTGDGISADDGRLGNVRIYVDLNNNGQFDAATETDVSTLTLANGTWSMTGLGSEVIGHKVLEVVPSGYVQTAGNSGYTITVDPTTGIADKTGLDFANFLFNPAAELTQGYWANHLQAWDGAAGLGKTTSTNDVPHEVNPRTDGKLLLGDLDHDGVIDANEAGHTLLIDLTAAQKIEAGATGGDARIIMLAQAIATQLDINNGFYKYGTDNLEPHNLITEAVDWLIGTGGVLGDGVLAGQGTVNKTTGAVTGGEWAASGNQFYLGAGTTTWGANHTFGSVSGINGEDIKNALMWFNQGQLVVSQDGNGVAWNNAGTLENFQTNAIDNFWLTLSAEHLV
jgi:hypothetical protein